MGLHLIREAADHRPDGLTWRERCALLILAFSAIDDTRQLPEGIEDKPEIIRRLGLGRSERYAVFSALVDKGALVHRERGRNGVKAAYAIAPLGTLERPGDPDVPPVENPLKGPGNPDASASGKGPGFAAEGSGFHPSKGPGIPDPAPYKGIRGFKTGGKTPPPPNRPLFPYGLPTEPPEEGDTPDAKKPAPCGTPADRQALAAEITAIRPEWSRRSVLRALERPAVTERPWPVAAEAMRIMAADPATQFPGRLEHDGSWWPEAARRTRATTASGTTASGAHRYDHDPDTGLCRECRAPQVDKIHRHRHRRTA
jgi:hypothetical protein